MNLRHHYTGIAAALLALLAQAPAGFAQVPVDDDGNLIGEAAPAAPAYPDDDAIPLRSASELESLVGPVALYPDDLLAIVLPAATYPLQVVQAARFLEALESDPSLQPDEDWDDSIVALVNYPEVVEMMNEDLDWTWQLGEAVVAQQSEVINAIATFRDRAYTAGNLKSDDRQTVARNDDDVIEIAPVSEEVIYVPYYEPERVVVYQPRPVYYYYPRAYPVYYYPYPSYYSFSTGYFWGVTTAFSIGWNSWNLCTYHPTYYGHPYYGYNYRRTWWYRQPSVHVYNNYYVNNNVRADYRSRHGDTWRPRAGTRLRYSDQRITRNSYYPNPATTGTARSQSRSIQGAYTRSPDKRTAPARSTPPTAAGTRTQRDDGNSVQRMRGALEAGTAPRQRTSATPSTRSRSNEPGSVDRMRSALGASTASRQSARTVPETRSREPAADVQARQRAMAANRSYTTTGNAAQARTSANDRRSAAETAPTSRRTPTYSTTRPAEPARPASRSHSTAPATRAPAATPSRAPAPTSRPPAPASRQPATSSRPTVPSTRQSAPASRSSVSSGNRRSSTRTR